MVYVSCIFLSTSHSPTKPFKKIHQSAPHTGESQMLVSLKTPSSWETRTYNGLTVPNTTSTWTWIQLNPYPACSMNFDAFHGFFFGLRSRNSQTCPINLGSPIWRECISMHHSDLGRSRPDIPPATLGYLKLKLIDGTSEGRSCWMV